MLPALRRSREPRRPPTPRCSSIPGWPTPGRPAAFISDQGEHYDARRNCIAAPFELNPSHAVALMWYGGLLRKRGDIDAGTKYLERAATVDPLSVIVQTILGDALEGAGAV